MSIIKTDDITLSNLAIGHVFRMLRKKNGISQSRMSVLIDASQPTMARIEQGSGVTVFRLRAVCELFSIPETAFLAAVDDYQDVLKKSVLSANNAETELKSLVSKLIAVAD